MEDDAEHAPFALGVGENREHVGADLQPRSLFRARLRRVVSCLGPQLANQQIDPAAHGRSLQQPTHVCGPDDCVLRLNAAQELVQCPDHRGVGRLLGVDHPQIHQAKGLLPHHRHRGAFLAGAQRFQVLHLQLLLLRLALQPGVERACAQGSNLGVCGLLGFVRGLRATALFLPPRLLCGEPAGPPLAVCLFAPNRLLQGVSLAGPVRRLLLILLVDPLNELWAPLL